MERIKLSTIVTATRFTISEIRNKSKRQDLVIARVVLSNYLYRFEKKNLSEIGRLINRNHSTIHYYLKFNKGFFFDAYNNFVCRLEIEKTLDDIVDDIKLAIDCNRDIDLVLKDVIKYLDKRVV